MNHRNNRRSEATRNKIKQSLIEMLHEQPLGKITVQALCELASINRSTFYNHYDSPESVLKNIETDFSSGLERHMEGYYTVENSAESLTNMLARILEYMQMNQNICFLLQTPSLEPIFRRNVFRNIFTSCLFSHPVFEKYTDDARVYMQTFLLYGCGHCIDHWIRCGCEDSPAKIASLIAGFIMKF